MIAKTQLRLGNALYEFAFDEGKDEKEIMSKAITLGNAPHYCDVCQNTQFFKFISNKDKEGNIYINVMCTNKGCGARAKLGSYKPTGSGFFWHKFEKYQKDGGQGGTNSTTEAPASEDVNNEEIPF